MKRKNAGYINNVDRLIEDTPVDVVLSYYGLPVPDSSSGEYRMICPFNATCAESQYGNLTVKLNDPAKVIYCHSCEVRGNLLTLVHGLETNRPPATGRLRGQEFKNACIKLQQIKDGRAIAPTNERPMTRSLDRPSDATQVVSSDVDRKSKRNLPLIRSANETARHIANLYEDLVTEIEAMPPEVATYFRKRPWLTKDVCEKWDIGYLPRNGRSMFRGWIVYTHRNQRGEVISYSGRDPRFESKWNRWIRDGKPNSKKPMKHKYVKGFHKGSELYGQQANRLEEARLRQSLDQFGLFIVEGMNDVVRLDPLGVAAVGLCSNRATDHQVEMISKFAKQVSNNRVVLMPDCDEEGEAGFRDLLWNLSERNIEVKLAWSRGTINIDGFQPELIDEKMMERVLERVRPGGM